MQPFISSSQKITGNIFSIIGVLILITFYYFNKSNVFAEVLQTLNARSSHIPNAGWGLLNIGLSVLIHSKEPREDERVEKIRNHSLSFTFRVMLFVALIMGFVLDQINLLLILATIQIYYIMLFRLCLFRDSAVVFANRSGKEEYVNKHPGKIRPIVYAASILPMIFGRVLFKLNTEEFASYLAFITISQCVIMTIAFHWKSDSLKAE